MVGAINHCSLDALESDQKHFIPYLNFSLSSHKKWRAADPKYTLEALDDIRRTFKMEVITGEKYPQLDRKLLTYMNPAHTHINADDWRRTYGLTSLD